MTRMADVLRAVDLPPALPFEFWRTVDVAFACARGKPFVHLGRSLLTGFDCLGLMRWFYGERLALPFPMPSAGLWYPRKFWETGLDSEYLLGLLKLFAKLPEGDVQRGDLVMFRPPNKSANVGHTGIVDDAAKHTFVHAYFRRGVTTSCWDERVWRDALFGFGRFRRMDLLTARAAQLPIPLKAAGREP